jgi:hypothetical protein
MKRRQFLGLGAGMMGALGGVSTSEVAPATASDEEAVGYEPDTSPGGAIDRAFEYIARAMDVYQQGGTLRLIQTYSDALGLGSAAFIYDSSLTIVAMLARGRPDDRARAVLLGDSLLYAQAHDPVYSDGRLRSAYWVGPFSRGDVQNDAYFVRPDGTVNLALPFRGGSTGEMAWAGIALAWLFAYTRDRRYLDGAARLGQWIVDSAFDTVGLGGYTFGIDADNRRIAPTKSLEHNIGVYTLFINLLAPLTGDPRWNGFGEHAREFIESMWSPEGGFFYVGSNDGRTVNDAVLAVDVQAWSYLALLDQRYAAALDWGKTNLATTDTPRSINSSLQGNIRFSGVTLSTTSRRSTDRANPSEPPSDPDAVWFTGTAQLAAALLARRHVVIDLPTFHGDVATAIEYLHHIALAQDVLARGQTVGGVAIPDGMGVVPASSVLNTGFGFAYHPVLHLATTSWSLIAALRVNPYRLP